MKRRRGSLLLVAATLVAACSSDSGTDVQPPPPVTVSQVSITGLTGPLAVGSTAQLNARAVGSNNAELPLTGRTVNWSSSNTAVATVSNTGLLTAVAVGSATITVTVDGVAGSAVATIENPRPTLTAVAPTSVTAGQAVTLVVTGSGFVPTSVIRSGTTNLQTTFVSSTELRCAACVLTTAGAQAVTVVNPAPGGGTSNSLTLTVLPGAPTITSISPTTALVGAAVTLTVNGTNFVPTSQIHLNGAPVATTFVSETRLTTSIASGTLTAGTVQVTVVNPGVATPSNAVALTVSAPSACATRPEYSVGSTISGALTTSDCSIDGFFTDLYTINLTNATAITLSMTSDVFDSFLQFSDANGNTLAFNDDATTTNRHSMLRLLAPSGTYLVQASSATRNAAGPYTLTSSGSVFIDVGLCVEWWLLPRITIGETISTNCAITGTNQYVDPYHVFLRAGQTVSFTMTSTAFDAFLELRTAAGAVVATDDNSAGGTNARLTYTATSTGTYVLRARPALPGVTGNYTLTYH